MQGGTLNEILNTTQASDEGLTAQNEKTKSGYSLAK